MPYIKLATKIEKIMVMRSEIDGHVWSVFYKYIAQMKILFSSPNVWVIDHDSIVFLGEDGCRGCYDSKTLSIPIKFFTDTNKAFRELTAQIECEKMEKETRKIKAEEELDYKEYTRLKEKFENKKEE